MHDRRFIQAFTLIELLVVITIIVVLLAMLTPSLDKALEQAERVRCSAQQQALVKIYASYAIESNRMYPRATTGCGGDASFYANNDFVELIKTYAGDGGRTVRGTSMGNDGSTMEWGGMPAILTDPSYVAFGFFAPSCQWVFGYNYLAQRPLMSVANSDPPVAESPAWESPMSLGKSGSGDMMACMNTWYDGGYAWVAHTKVGGPLGGDAPTGGYYYYGTELDPREAGGAGGNVGRVDGSVAWIDIDNLRQYYSVADTNQGSMGLW